MTNSLRYIRLNLDIYRSIMAEFESKTMRAIINPDFRLGLC